MSKNYNIPFPENKKQKPDFFYICLVVWWSSISSSIENKGLKPILTCK